MNQPIPAVFHGVSFSIIDHGGKKWLTAEQIGLALGYNPANAGQGVRNLYNRHADEFTEADTGEINLISPGGRQNVRCFSSTGCIKLGFFANTGRAKDFRAWAAKVLDGQPAVAPAPRQQNGQIEALKAALFRTNRLYARLARYTRMGLTPSEIGRLVGKSADAVRHHQIEMAACGLIERQVNPLRAQAGRKGHLAMVQGGAA